MKWSMSRFGIKTKQGRVIQLFSPKDELYKCIGFILPVVIYGEKVYKLWVSYTSKYPGEASGKIDRDVFGKTYLLNESCHIHRFNYCSLSNLNMLFYTF